MVFSSQRSSLGDIKIDNVGINLSQGFVFFKNIEAIIGIEGSYRWAQSRDGISPFFGSSVQRKVHVQGVVGIGYKHKDTYIRIATIVPPLSEITAFAFSTTGTQLDRLRVERAMVFRLEVGYFLKNF